MTKVEVWTARAVTKRNVRIEAKLIWSGEMDAIPTAGDFIVLGEGWASSLIDSVHYNLFDGTVEIIITPDYTDSYTEIPK